MKIILKLYLNLLKIIEKSIINLLIFLIKNDKSLLLEIGFSERDINRLSLEFRTNF